MARPLDERILSEVRFVTGREVSPYIAVRAALARAIQEGVRLHASGVSALWCGADAGPGGAFLAAVVPGGDLVESERRGRSSCPRPSIRSRRPTSRSRWSSPPPQRPPRAAGRRLVLVVDDEPENPSAREAHARGRGYAVETAADGAEALAKAEALVPDLVLLDAMLPRVHGFEACRRLKAGARTRHIPVVMMTAVYRGWRFAEDAREAYGAEDYVEKPFRHRRPAAPGRGRPRRRAARPRAAAAGASPPLARGRELLAAGGAAEAIDALDEAVRADPFSVEAHHFARARPPRARRALPRDDRARARRRARPNHLAALRALAALYEETGFRRKAAETLERALPPRPTTRRAAAIRRDLLRLL